MNTTTKNPRRGKVQVSLAREIVDQQDQQGQVRLPSKYEVIDRVGVTYVTLWKWMREGKFPRSRELHGKSAWIASEVEEWIQARPIRRLKGDADTVAA